MSAVLANLLRFLGVGALGYTAGDVVNWFQIRKRTGVEPAPFGRTIAAVFTSRGFMLFMVVILISFYLIFKDRFKKTRK